MSVKGGRGFFLPPRPPPRPPPPQTHTFRSMTLVANDNCAAADAADGCLAAGWDRACASRPSAGCGACKLITPEIGGVPPLLLWLSIDVRSDAPSSPSPVSCTRIGMGRGAV